MKIILTAMALMVFILHGRQGVFAQKSERPEQAATGTPETAPPDSLSCGLLDYGGQVYHTVKIGQQCWMSDNLNIGKWTDESQIQKEQDDGIIEKYCYGNNFTQCDYWGGLYQWNELMGYTQASGAQGICPAGWHVPSSQDW